MAKLTLNSSGVVRDRTDDEIKVLEHVVLSEDGWINGGRFGIISGQVEDAERRMAEAIIITARVKQMDPDGFLEACNARASGLSIDGQGDAARAAVAFLLNNLEPDEANSLAGGTDVTDRAVIRCKNAAMVEGALAFDVALVGKVNKWEESYDRSTWKHGDQYLNRTQREVEVTRRKGLTKAQRMELPSLGAEAVLKVQTGAAAKAILGSGR